MAYYGILLLFQAHHEAMHAICTSERRMHPGHTHLSSCIVVRDFQKARGSVKASLLAYPDGSSMLRRDFDDSLKQLLVICGHQTSYFKGHSFRIGAATDAALKGESDPQIRAAGRWTSDALNKSIMIA